MSNLLKKKKKFSNNQPVVFRFSDRRLIGTIVQVKPIGKKFLYDVLGENGSLYSDLEVDVEMNHSIDTYLTKLFYKKYDIDENAIPEIEHEVPETSMTLNYRSQESEEYEHVSDERLIDREMFYDEDELDPNY